MSERNRPKAIDLGDLAEVVLGAVSRAQAERLLFPYPPRIICGIIVDNPLDLTATATGLE
jgi:hypothetical protein